MNFVKLKKIYYVSGTHWDREWYKSFQGFRYMMMDTIRDVVETLEKNPDMKYMLDGQTAVLDDFTEIDADYGERIKKLIASKQIAVGPWYTMPDEFLLSGEALINNLQLGHRKSKEYGADDAMKYGYICDIFGHIAQMPQIFSGFGIHGAFLQRGNNMESCTTHFKWVSPDGTECSAYRANEDFGYGAFYHFVTEPFIQGWDTSKENMLTRAIQQINKELSTLNAPYLILTDALDHQRINKEAPWLAKKLSEHFGCPVVFDPLDNLVEDMTSWKGEQTVKHGELGETSKISAGTNILLTYTLSSRYDIKKANDIAQISWEKWGDPLLAYSSFKGKKISPRFRKVAMLELIRNHAHDSICGCSIEAVHKDMHYRYRQTIAIAEEITRDCFGYDFRKATENNGGANMVLRVFNPLPFERKETIKIDLRFNTDFPASFSEGERIYEIKNAFKIADKNGVEMPYTLCDIRKKQLCKSPSQYLVDEYTICFNAEMSAAGYTEYQVIPVPDKRMRYMSGLCKSPLSAENNFLKLKINSDGTISISDKSTGESYEKLISYQDCADIGDGWMFISPANNTTVFSKGSPVITELLYDGPAECAFRITTHMEVPEDITYGENTIKRSDKRTTLDIVTTVRLGADNGYVDVDTTVRNTAKNHRLQLLFPTGVKSSKYYSGQAFTVIERETGFDRSTGDWKEPDTLVNNFNGLIFNRNTNENGLAFLSPYGLHEAGVMDDEDGTMVVTLFRGFDKTVGTNGETDGQLLGDLSFRYRLMPIDKTVSNADMVRSLDTLQAEIYQYTIFTGDNYALQNDSFMKIESRDIAVSAIKLPEDGEADTVIVRLVNYSDSDASADITFSREIAKVFLADLLENPSEDCVVNVDSVKIVLSASKIQTLRIKLK